MSEEMLVRCCAPTLAGLKTGSLFSCPTDSKADMVEELRSLNRALVPKGFRVLPLRYSHNSALIYVFCPKALKRDLCDCQAAQLLAERGYPVENADKCIMTLIRRLRAQDSFPHEIGLFLGYPPEDVRGFIRNGANNCKCSGLWKVYGDEKKARMRFEMYEKCTRCYCRQYHSGVSIERLAVENKSEEV